MIWKLTNKRHYMTERSWITSLCRRNLFGHQKVLVDEIAIFFKGGHGMRCHCISRRSRDGQENKNRCISGRIELKRETKTSNLSELYDNMWDGRHWVSDQEHFRAAPYTKAWNLILAEHQLLQPGAKQNCFMHNTSLNWVCAIVTDFKPNFNFTINVFRRLSYVVFFAIHLYISDRLWGRSLGYFSKQLCSEWIIFPLCILIVPFFYCYKDSVKS